MDPRKVDPAGIRRLRDERAWSQEHLAAVTGLSLRTIQRVESDGTASTETRMALATAFGVDPKQLRPPAVIAAESQPPVQVGNSSASGPPSVSKGRQLPWLYYRLLRLVIFISLFVGLDVYENDRITWSRWIVVFGVAIGGLRLVRRRFVESAGSRR